jgi:hypothetical protein
MAIAERIWTDLQPALTKMGIDPIQAKKDIWEWNETRFQRACVRLTEKQRVCLKSSKTPATDHERCKIKRSQGARLGFSSALLPRTDRRVLSGAESEKLKKDFEGTWIRKDDWETQTWVIDGKGAATRTTVREGQETKTQKYIASFEKEHTVKLGNPEMNSWQTVPFYRSAKAVHIYFNNYYSVEPVTDERKFTLSTSGDVLFFESGKCTVLDADTSAYGPATCSWSTRDGRKIFSFKFSDNGRMRDENWILVRGNLIHGALWKTAFVRQ